MSGVSNVPPSQKKASDAAHNRHGEMLVSKINDSDMQGALPSTTLVLHIFKPLIFIYWLAVHCDGVAAHQRASFVISCEEDSVLSLGKG